MNTTRNFRFGLICYAVRVKSNNCCLMWFWWQVSALLGRIPSAVGYQPTLATDMGTMQERITTTRKGSITSVQVSDIYSCLVFQFPSEI